MLVIRLGNVGLVTVISSLVLTFVNTPSPGEQAARLFWLLAGLVVLFLLARSDWVETHLARLIQAILGRYTDLEVQDYASLLGIEGGYRLAEVSIQPGSWLANKTLSEANIADEGILILGIYRPNGTYVGAPQGETRINPEDRLVVYGQAEPLSQLSHRLHGRTGDEAHQRAMNRQDSLLARQRAKDGFYSDYSSSS